jgi:L-iditol 2-dehydrogenase
MLQPIAGRLYRQKSLNIRRQLSIAHGVLDVSCLNYRKNYGDVDKGHRANGFTTDGGFCEYQVNNLNTLVAIPDSVADEEATLVVTAGTAMYGLTELGGLVAGESVVVTGPGPIGLLGVAVAKALGAAPVILTGTRDNRLKIGLALGADHVINVRSEDAVAAVHRLNGGLGVVAKHVLILTEAKAPQPACHVHDSA